MLLDLQKDDLLCLVRGTEPSGEKLTTLRATQFGAISSAFEKWVWSKHALAKLSEDELLSLYCFIVDAMPMEGLAPVEEPPPPKDELSVGQF